LNRSNRIMPQRTSRIGPELGQHRLGAWRASVVAEHVIDAHGLAGSALRVADELGLEAFREACARQWLPLDAPREAAHRVTRWYFECREIDLSLDELRGDGD